jgi:hypothetical protein
MLQPGAEAIERIGAHAVIAAPAIGTKRPIRDIAAETLGKPRAARQRPIDQRGKTFRNQRLQPERGRRDPLAKKIAEAPQQTEPAGPIIEGVVDIDQHRRMGLELSHADGKPRRRIGHVVKHPQGIAEIHAGIGERHRLERGLMKAAMGKTGQAPACHRKRHARGVNAMQAADARRHQRGPAPAAAAGVETHRVAGQILPGKDSEIFREHPRHLVAVDAALIEAPPFLAEISDRRGIDILRIAHHRDPL